MLVKLAIKPAQPMDFESYVNSPGFLDRRYYLDEDDRVKQCRCFDDFMLFAFEKAHLMSGGESKKDYHAVCKCHVDLTEVGRYAVHTFKMDYQSEALRDFVRLTESKYDCNKDKEEWKGPED